MALKLIAVDSDEDTQDDCVHIPLDPPCGGGSYPISPITDQYFVSITGKRIVPKAQEFDCSHGPYSCKGYAGNNSTCSTLVFIAGVPVCRAGDVSQSSDCHTFSGITVSQQDFVFDDS